MLAYGQNYIESAIKWTLQVQQPSAIIIFFERRKIGLDMQRVVLVWVVAEGCMDINLIVKMREKRELELEALRIVEEMIKRDTEGAASTPTQSARTDKPATVTVGRGRPNGNGSGSKTKRQMILEAMAVRQKEEWTTQEVVHALRANGYDAKSNNVSGELARLSRMGDIRQVHKGEGRWDGSRWMLK
jgi:hypothetical protein